LKYQEKIKALKLQKIATPKVNKIRRAKARIQIDVLKQRRYFIENTGNKKDR